MSDTPNLDVLLLPYSDGSFTSKYMDDARSELMTLKNENAHRGLTLATLCDMLLGEGAEDRSDDALIRRARELLTFWEAHQ